MKLKLPKNSNLKEQYICDNSSECDGDTAFLITPLSAKYIDDAKNRGVATFVAANELRDIFDLSAIKIIGITGTNGKTTTAAAIYSLLLDSGKKVALQGTRGFFVNENRVEEKSLTTPMQLNIFANILAALAASGHNLKERLYISKKAHLILPTHRMLDAAYEAAKGAGKIGIS